MVQVTGTALYPNPPNMGVCCYGFASMHHPASLSNETGGISENKIPEAENPINWKPGGGLR